MFKKMSIVFLTAVAIAFSSHAHAGFLFGYMIGNMQNGGISPSSQNQSLQEVLYQASPEVLKMITDELSVRVINKTICPVIRTEGKLLLWKETVNPNLSLREHFQMATTTATPKTLLRIVFYPNDNKECGTMWFYYINNQ